MAKNNEKGIALIMTLLVMMLMTALLVGFTAVVSSDQRYRFIDRDRNRAFYGASAGIEKMTNDLGSLFLDNVAPSEAALTTLAGNYPSIDLINFTSPSAPSPIPTSSLLRCRGANSVRRLGGNGYSLSYCQQPDGKPTFTDTPSAIVTGPYEGLIAQQMPYQLDVTAVTAGGGEVHLARAMEAVAIPIFQFGIFSDMDLSFFAGPNFNFNGRVHTNGNLWLSEGDGATLKLFQKVTAVKEVIRDTQQNLTMSGATAHGGTVSMAQAPNVFRSLAMNEGSVVLNSGGAGTAWPGIDMSLTPPNTPVANQNPSWHTTSIGTYNSYVRNGRTGARALNLSVILFNGSNIDLIERPKVTPVLEVVGSDLYKERMFTKASLRILLSDTAANITDVPGIGAGTPWSLEGDWRGGGTPAGYTLGTPLPLPDARFTGSVNVAATITAGNPAANTARNITLTTGAGAFTTSDAAHPNPFTYTITVTKPGPPVVTRTLTCTGVNATQTQLTGCINPATGAAWNTGVLTRPMSLTATLPNAADGTAGATATIPLTADWANNTTTISLNTLLLPTFEVTIAGIPVACNGPSTNAALRNCTVVTPIVNGATLSNGVLTTANVNTLGGFIKIERGNTDGTYTDITPEILNYGIAGPNLGAVAGTSVSGNCGNPNAIITLQRARDTALGTCRNGAVDYWPNALFDTREALQRDTAPANLVIGGVMYYIGVDATNLSNWFRRQGAYAATGTGNLAKTDNGGYTLYFSDRRNNRKADGTESGELGFEDIVNPNTAGVPDGQLQAGEDLNGDGAVDVYGNVPNYRGTYNSAGGTSAPLSAAATLRTSLAAAPVGPLQAQVNRPIFFRHALKLFNGRNLVATGITGLTIVSENPVYLQGDWNAPGNFNNPDVATSVIADAVTLLSNEWSDANSFRNPYVPGNRARATESYYRLAILAGKGPAFARPNEASAPNDFGTDGGAHNFLRYLESGLTVHYMGSIATLYYNRQGVGTFKCCSTVYSAPVRDYNFDTNFLTPALLPPNTPMFRDLNAVGFAQELRPGR